jgi:hypothetical protein
MFCAVSLETEWQGIERITQHAVLVCKFLFHRIQNPLLTVECY